jgi:hypothetical protein
MIGDPVYGDSGAAASSGGGSAAGGASGAMAAMSLVSTLFGAYSQYQKGQVNKKLAEYNAKIAEFQAQDAIDRGVVAATRSRVVTSGVIGSERAQLAHQGVDINEAGSSAVDVQANTRYLGELDALTIKNNAALQAWGFRQQAAQSTFQGTVAQIGGQNAAVSTLLTGSSQVLLAKYGYGRSPLATDPNIPVNNP